MSHTPRRTAAESWCIGVIAEPIRCAAMTAAGEADQLVDMINGAMESTIPMAHKIGLRVVEAGRGHAAVTVPVEGNGNHFGVVYAGAQFVAAESSAASSD